MAFNNGGGHHALDPELQAQLEEAKAMSASFTKAGGKSRPGGARRNGAGSSGGRTLYQYPPIKYSPSNNFGPNRGRLGPVGSGARTYSSAINTPSFKNASPPKLQGSGGYYGGNVSLGSASTKIGPYNVGPVNSQAAPAAGSIPSTMLTKVPPHMARPVAPNSGSGFSGSIINLSTSAPQALAQSVSTAATNFSNGFNNSATSMRDSIIASSQSTPALFSSFGSGFNSNASSPTTAVPKPAVSEVASATDDGRELIVTNWTEDEKGKPFIPAHLQQPSAIQAIQEIAAMIHKPVEEFTADGVSIPRPREGARPLVTFPTTVNAPKQSSVDPTGWFMAATHNTPIESVNPVVANGPISTTGAKVGFGNSRAPSYGAMEMDIDTIDGFVTNNTAGGGVNGWGAPAPPIAQAGPTPLPPLAPKRPSDLSGSIWSDTTWKLASHQFRKENVYPTSDSFGSHSRGASGTKFGGNFGQGAGPSTAPSFGGGSWKTTLNQQIGGQVDQGSSAPASKQGKKTGTLADSIWA